MAIRPLAAGHHTVTPYLAVQGAERLITFLKQAFEGQELEWMSRPDGTIGHAEVRIGDSTVMISDAEGMSKPMPSAIYLSVTDTDAVSKRALRAGATPLMAPVDHLHGGVRDPVGNVWWIARHSEDVPGGKMASRAAAETK